MVDTKAHLVVDLDVSWSFELEWESGIFITLSRTRTHNSNLEEGTDWIFAAKVAKSLCSFAAEMFPVTCFGVVLTQRHEGSEVFEGLESSA